MQALENCLGRRFEGVADALLEMVSELLLHADRVCMSFFLTRCLINMFYLFIYLCVCVCLLAWIGI